jgi:iron complex transport system substrate-binding protein
VPPTRKTTRLALAAVLLTLLAPACGSPDRSAPAPGGQGAGSAQQTWPRTITHAMGRTELPRQPRRVVALDNSYVEATMLLGAEVVGFTEYRGITDTLPDYLGDDRTAHAGRAVSVGTVEEPGLEQIAALKPDLIVSAKVRHEALYAQLAQIAPTIMSETTGPTWKQNITFLGRSLGREDVARRELAAYQTEAKKVGDAIRAEAGDPKISVVRFLDGPTRLYQKASFSGTVLQDAGLSRPRSQDVDDFDLEIGEERIALADGDKIFVATFDDEKRTGSATKASFAANPLWKPLAEKVVEVPDATWMTSVSVQGAYRVLADLAQAYGVPGPSTR